MTCRQFPPREQTFDMARAGDDLRQHIAKAEVFITPADDLFEEVRSNPHRRRRFAWALTEAAIATQAAWAAGKKLAEDVVKHGAGT